MGTEEKKREQGKPILWSQKMVFFFHQPLGHGLIYLILHSFAASATEEGLILQVIPKPLWRGKGVHSNLTQEFPLWLRIQLVSTRSSVRSLAFLTGIRIRRCSELRCRLQMQLGFWDAVLLSCWLFFSLGNCFCFPSSCLLPSFGVQGRRDLRVLFCTCLQNPEQGRPLSPLSQAALSFSVFFSDRKHGPGFSVVAQWLTNLIRNHEVAGSLPGLDQWVKDLALL